MNTKYVKPTADEWTEEDFTAMRKDWGDNTLVGWRLIYTDGTEITSREMRFVDAPQDGVQVLIKYYERAKGGYSWEVQNGLDMYTLTSLLPLKLDLPPEIKRGENLTRAEFDTILSFARLRAGEDIVTEMQDEIH